MTSKKIAILGKGGSGKTSLSWLLVNYLSQNQKTKTLAIDGDHNMDLSACLGYLIDSQTRYFKDFNSTLWLNPPHSCGKALTS